MYAQDFCYDGKLLSDFGFVICEVDANNDIAVVETSVPITFNRVPYSRGRRNGLTGTQYDECFTATFNICKKVCTNSSMEITSFEYRTLVRWLNRNSFFPFYFCSEDRHSDTSYFNASFNLTKKVLNGKTYVVELVMETDAPFGYGYPITHKLETKTSETKYDINCYSDEEGYIYPDIVITCTMDGTVRFENLSIDAGEISIKNCVKGEKITIHGDTQIIQSSVASHAISKDFNFNFLKLSHPYEKRENTLIVRDPCIIELTYTPVIKDVI